MKKLFQIPVPFGSELVDITYIKMIAVFTFSLKRHILDWTEEQFGYRPSVKANHDDHQYLIRFRSERDAVLFKTFWC